MKVDTKSAAIIIFVILLDILFVIYNIFAHNLIHIAYLILSDIIIFVPLFLFNFGAYNVFKDLKKNG